MFRPRLGQSQVHEQLKKHFEVQVQHIEGKAYKLVDFTVSVIF